MKLSKHEVSKMNYQTPNTVSRASPLIKLPFPPVIKASDIVDRRKPSRFKSKSPNAFLIYRKAFLDELSHLKHNLRMTDVSKLVSKHWRNETECVKDEYRKIAQQVDSELSEKRKKAVSYRVVWKNSKYSKRSQLRKKMKGQDGKSEVVQSNNAKSNVSSNRGNIF